LEWAILYLTQLSLKKRDHCIWPNHCIIGSRGHAVVEPIAQALKFWEAKTHKAVTYVMKGFNTKVEFYSAFQAEVKDPEDPKSGFNYELLNKLKMNDLVRRIAVFVFLPCSFLRNFPGARMWASHVTHCELYSHRFDKPLAREQKSPCLAEGRLQFCRWLPTRGREVHV
jgi:hypothetical protein